MDVDFMMVPLILFMIFVAPLWLWLHYRSKRQVAQGLSKDDLQQLHQLLGQADHMRQRIDNLESILDAEQPNWRERYDAR